MLPCWFSCLLADGGDVLQCFGAAGATSGSGAELLTSVMQPRLTAASVTPPTITLVTTPSLAATVKLLPGSTYAPCAAGQQPSGAKPCELGAVAVDAQGNNLTLNVSLTERCQPLCADRRVRRYQQKLL
jgi:hypothetical protein